MPSYEIITLERNIDVAHPPIISGRNHGPIINVNDIKINIQQEHQDNKVENDTEVHDKGT